MTQITYKIHIFLALFERLFEYFYYDRLMTVTMCLFMLTHNSVHKNSQQL